MTAAPRQWVIKLAYPTLPLSLNDRRHRMVIWRESRNLRNRVRTYAQHVGIPRLNAIHVQLEWTPATRRKRDADNVVATLKPAIDGLRDYPAKYKRDPHTGEKRLVEPAWRGVVPDDDPEHVTWSQPIIHPANPDRWFVDRLVLVVTERKTE